MQSGYLDLETRRSIYECIKKSPGLHFREVQRRTNLATGSLDYHVHFLHKTGLIRTEKVGGFTRYYTTDTVYQSEEKDLLNLLRQKSVRKIVIHLLQKKKSTASDIARAAGMSPSNLSWYLKSLAEKKIVVQRKKGRFRFYSITSRENIIKCLVTYKESFFDSLVDGFIEAWESEK
ncbi:MAG: winged helix-turn-helix transcriptional regulator [Candidatus Aenigmarchaeota archaeon]|nr:winged helix-turn-helix transcriptional regulator [Candidatus Aenigmarchaeota archaeon]